MIYSILLAALTVGVSPDLLSAICFVESGHRPTVVNWKDGGSPSHGLCQVKLRTARYVGFTGSSRDLLDPYTNALYAAKYLKKQTLRYKSCRSGVIAYNAGNFKTRFKGKYYNSVINVLGDSNVHNLGYSCRSTKIKPVRPYCSSRAVSKSINTHKRHKSK